MRFAGLPDQFRHQVLKQATPGTVLRQDLDVHDYLESR
jgi:hypothetical protein